MHVILLAEGRGNCFLENSKESAFFKALNVVMLSVKIKSMQAITLTVPSCKIRSAFASVAIHPLIIPDALGTIFTRFWVALVP